MQSGKAIKNSPNEIKLIMQLAAYHNFANIAIKLNQLKAASEYLMLFHFVSAKKQISRKTHILNFYIFQATAFDFHQRVTAARQKSGVDCLVLIL